jgi:biopolymer transport protein ExbD
VTVPTPPKSFDVWFVAANTVYKAVPYNVVADWTGQGRLAPSDQLKPSGSNEPWKRVDEYALLRDYAPPSAPTVAVVAGSAPAPVPEDHDFDPLPHRHKEGEDDEVDMIPLIDISMVLLVFFIMMQAAGAISPVDVPDMKFAGKLTDSPNAVTINIEKGGGETVYYAVRVGELAPKGEHNNLPNPEAALAALDSILGTVDKPPEVRLACNKALPSERVFEMIPELKKRQEKGQINSFLAEVNETPEGK